MDTFYLHPMTLFQTLLLLARRLVLPHSTTTLEWRLLQHLNRARKKEHLSTLMMQNDLRKVARGHSRDMAKKDYFSHTNLQGKSPNDRLKKARIGEAVSGENLAKIGGFAFPADRAHMGLMNSPGHRANILNNSYNCVGIGVVKSQDKIYYFTQNFARRLLTLEHIPKKHRRTCTLKIKGQSWQKGSILLVEIEDPLGKKHQEILPFAKNTFQKDILFHRCGPHVLRLYLKKGTHFQLQNTFDLKVMDGWW